MTMDKGFEVGWSAGKIAEGLTKKIIATEMLSNLTVGQIVAIQDLARTVAIEECERLFEGVQEHYEPEKVAL